MERALLALAIVVVATVVALVLRARRPAPPTQGAWPVPQQLDRDDFDAPGLPWLVAVFTSSTCESCALALEKAAVLACADVAVQDIPYQSAKDLHVRYGVEAVPTIVMADVDGVVRMSFVGTPSATDLWAAAAEARAPGSSPEPDLGTNSRDG